MFDHEHDLFIVEIQKGSQNLPSSIIQGGDQCIGERKLRVVFDGIAIGAIQEARVASRSIKR